jgi:MYXO-CTERM domain-containing protein
MRKIVTLAAVAAGLLATTPVFARDMIVPRPADRPMNTAAIGPGTIIYFNRQGGTYTQTNFGSDDSTQNRTSLPGGTLSPFACGDAAWQQVMSCLHETFGPFNVVITDTDPGSTPHIETVVAGDPSQVGLQSNIGGIAPASCLDILNPVDYAFANVAYMQCDPAQICWTAAQETAHTVGLDHEVICKDPMTYDSSCGNSKSFQNQTAQCGEFQGQTHSCFCGGSQQNSYTTLMQIFGARNDMPPDVSITQPTDGATVQKGFAVKVNATDDVKIDRVELYIDAAMIAQAQIPPYAFLVPDTYADGTHTITARAFDSANHSVDTTIMVTIKPPCTGNSDCGNGQVCNVQDGQCIAGPGQPGGEGATCTDSSMCASGICAAGPDGMRCVTVCTPGGTDCPDGFDCLSTGASGACWPRADTLNPGGSGGCAIGGRSPAWTGVLAFLGLALLLLRRRR